MALALLISGMIYGCGDNPVSPKPQKPCEKTNSCQNSTPNKDTSDTGNKYNFHSDYPYNLNVIYFTPTNDGALPNFRKRLSGYLLFIQDYYHTWMKYWGFDKTFGLLKDKGHVKITHVTGKHPISAYPNTGTGATKIQNEVRAYFKEHPNKHKDSDHYLVFTPKKGSNLPYFGFGRWGFVYDSGKISGEKVKHKGGGTVHELGHALNLPHNAHRKSVKNKIGMAIMNSGNIVWNQREGYSATSFTEASADILNECQVLSKKKGKFMEPMSSSLTSASASYEYGKITIEGTFQSSALSIKPSWC